VTRRALVVRGGWPGHHPVAATEEFLPHLRAHGFDVRVEDSPGAYADAEYMAGVDLVVQCVTKGALSGPELAGLAAAVRAGTGLAGWHGGIAASYPDPDYLHLVGGVFVCHPPKPGAERLGGEADYFLPHRVEVAPTAAEHPVTRGVEDFDLVTEQYWVLTDDAVDVLATTTLAARDHDPWHRPVTAPAVWTRRWGRGRVFVCTPGHDLDVLRLAPVRTIVERGLLWAAR
jgi:uncharacterized protein